MAGNLSRRGFVASAGAAFAATVMAGCSTGQGQADDATVEQDGIDYMALVNKVNPLPEGWEDALETVTITNSVGDEVEVEAKAYAAYEQLKADLEET